MLERRNWRGERESFGGCLENGEEYGGLYGIKLSVDIIPIIEKREGEQNYVQKY